MRRRRVLALFTVAALAGVTAVAERVPAAPPPTPDAAGNYVLTATSPDGSYAPHVPAFAGKRILTPEGKDGDANGAVIKELIAHGKLLANALAQAQALMVGRANADGHRHFPGNRPSTFLLLEALMPASLGALIALQEHRVFVSGSLWGINSFDQWGVELGKVLAQDLEGRLDSGDVAGLDGSTAGLLQRLLRKE